MTQNKEQAKEVYFGIADLRQMFPQFGHLGLDVLNLLFDRLIRDFSVLVPIDPIKRIQEHDFTPRLVLEITDKALLPQGNVFIYNGRIIEARYGIEHIPPFKGEGEYRDGITGVSVICHSDERLAQSFVKGLQSYISSQNLYDLRKTIGESIDPARFFSQEQADFYLKVDNEGWVSEMCGGITPRLILLMVFSDCEVLYPEDWQYILEEFYAMQAEHPFFTVLGLERQENGIIVSPVFYSVIQNLLDTGVIYVKDYESQLACGQVLPVHGETSLRIYNHLHVTEEPGYKKHCNRLRSPCRILRQKIEENFCEKEGFKQ